MKKNILFVVLFVSLVVVISASTTEAVNEDVKTYTVKKGDTLSQICEDLMENGSKKTYRRESTRLGIKNPNKIYPGKVINFPFVYRVAWASTTTGQKGHGLWFLDEKVLIAWVGSSNREFPEIQHVVESK
jgi:hypothetical protein